MPCGWFNNKILQKIQDLSLNKNKELLKKLPDILLYCNNKYNIVVILLIHYKLKKDEAIKILNDMQLEIAKWRTVAKKLGMGSSEIEQMKRAFRDLE